MVNLLPLGLIFNWAWLGRRRIVFFLCLKMLWFLVNYFLAYLFIPCLCLYSVCYAIRIWIIVRRGVRQLNVMYIVYNMLLLINLNKILYPVILIIHITIIYFDWIYIYSKLTTFGVNICILNSYSLITHARVVFAKLFIIFY